MAAQLIRRFAELVWTEDGQRFHARAMAKQQPTHARLWEGWLEFKPTRRGPTLRTGIETTQPTLADVRYWASGIEPIYLDGALERAQRHAAVVSRRALASRAGARPRHR